MEMCECLNTCSSIIDTLSHCSRSRPQPILTEREKWETLCKTTQQTISEIRELLLGMNENGQTEALILFPLHSGCSVTSCPPSFVSGYHRLVCRETFSLWSVRSQFDDIFFKKGIFYERTAEMLNLYQIVNIAFVSFQHSALSCLFICSETHGLLSSF